MVRRAPRQLDELIYEGRPRVIREWSELTRIRTTSAGNQWSILEKITHDEAQLLNYLKATRLELGVLI
jgi:hypothetical protein